MNNLNILKSVKSYEDLPSEPMVHDFTYIEDLNIGVVYTERGWTRVS